MSKNEHRNYVTLKCTECGFELRPTSKNKNNTKERLELNKFCPTCKKVVVFKEKK